MPIVIIHLNPLERFPPVMNLIDFLSKNTSQKIFVISTCDNGKNLLPRYINNSHNIIIKRAPAIIPTSLLRVFNYVFFYGYTLYTLLKVKPQSVLYYETISSWPALMYKKWRGKKVKLLTHYHEYLSPSEYKHGSGLVSKLYKMEKKMYSSQFAWLSHTNEVRLQNFLIDNNIINTVNPLFHTLPNYPSISWAKEKTRFLSGKKIRLIYVGSLGYDTMYLKEITEWVFSNKEYITLDFYSYNINEKAKKYLSELNNSSINFQTGAAYNTLPSILKNYDVGLVIYKPVSKNWIDNAPNKVFEYLACGLDVWFPQTMTYILSLRSDDVYPKIVPVNFEDLDNFNFKKAVNRAELEFKGKEFYYEKVYPEILKNL